MYWDQEITTREVTEGGTSYQEKGEGVSYSKYIDTRIADTRKIFDEQIKRLEMRIENVEKEISELKAQRKRQQEHGFSLKLGIVIAIISTLMSLLVDFIKYLFK